MKILLIIIISIGIAGGFGVAIFVLVESIINLYKYFTWNEIKLTAKEKEEFLKALEEESPTNMVISKISNSRGFNWKSWTYNKATEKLRIR